MKKAEELANPYSCLNKAKDDEPLFVLKASDPAAASAIRHWIGKRLALGLNTISDEKMVSAAALAAEMEEYRK